MALGAALTSSVSVILFKRSEAISPLGLNLFKNVADTILLAVTLVLLGEGMDLERSTEDWLRLAASGVLSEPQRPKGPQRREGDGLAISASFAYAHELKCRWLPGIHLAGLGINSANRAREAWI